MYVNVDVDVDVYEVLRELDDEEIIEELQRRGLDLNTEFVDGDTMRGWLTAVWQKRRLGQEYQAELDQLIYYGLGKVL